MMQTQRFQGWRLPLLSVVLLSLSGCSGDASVDPQAADRAALSGHWDLTIVSTVETGPVEASPQRYDALLAFDEGADTFRMTEWRDGQAETSTGMFILEGDQLSLIHTEDYQTVDRVQEAICKVHDGKLTLVVVEDGEYLALGFERL
jgi:hypothetical protein